MSRFIGGPADGWKVEIDFAGIVSVPFIPEPDRLALPIGPNDIAMIRDKQTGELRTPRPAMGTAQYVRRGNDYHCVSESITPGEVA